MLHVVLYQPEIPPNTGNIIRLCANAGAALHLIEPMGFSLDDRKMKRAGLDYHEWARIEVHSSLNALLESGQVERLLGFSTHARTHYTDMAFRPADGLLFGPETRGLPASVLAQLGPERCLRIPMQPHSRSLNLSNAAAVGLYEAWRQLGFDS